MRRALPTLLALLLAGRAGAADNPDTLARIRTHMREYLARLPDYTCRVTIERAQRPSRRSAYLVTDRLRLEIAYESGHEYYAWPGDNRFERSIEELLPTRGLVSEGSFALHMRKLFLTGDAEFGAPRTEADGVRIEFLVPAVRSGFAISAGGASAPAALHGALWFDPATLDIRRLEVRVEDTPESMRIANTREVTTYGTATVGATPVVLPMESELVLRDRDGSERRNRARFDDCHRYTGSATVRYEAAVEPLPAAPPAPVPLKKGQRVEVRFDAGIPADVAIGDLFGSGGAQLRVTDVRQTGNRWSIEFSLVGARGVTRRSLTLPAPPGTTVTLRVE